MRLIQNRYTPNPDSYRDLKRTIRLRNLLFTRFQLEKTVIISLIRVIRVEKEVSIIQEMLESMTNYT